MAEMIPDRMPSGRSQGEKRLFDILQKLPDDYLVYYEPIIGDRYPDFVVIAPDLGIVIIEDKGWYPNEILSGDLQAVRIRHRGIEENLVHPIRQARNYQNKLQDECQKSKQAQLLLLHATGEFAGRFTFPFCHFVVLSNITSEQLKQHHLGDLSSVFPSSKVLSKDESLQWLELPAEVIREKIREFFNPYWDIPRMTADQVNILRGVIHPEIRIESRYNPEQLAILDLRQEKHALDIGDGHRIIYGVAGSGKTVLLISRAKMLSQQAPQAEILVLVFNVALAAYLRGVLASCINVHVYHFDGWSKENGVTRQMDNATHKLESDEALGLRLKKRLQEGNGDSRRFDAILVDEAQDFDETWYDCALEAMKDPLDGDLLIVGDRQQGIRGTGKSFSWISIGINAKGRTINTRFDLDKNYRNSREILELAAAFAMDQEELTDDQFGIVRVDPAKSLRSTGIMPMLVHSTSRQHECQQATSIVATLLHSNGSRDSRFQDPLLPSQIGILYPFMPAREAPLMDSFIRELQRFAPVIWLREADRHRVNEPGIKIQTISSAKGLQYRAVILLWSDQLPRSFEDTDPAGEAKLMYVALTRPEDYLFITYSGPSPFIDRIRQSGKVVPY